MGRANEFLVRYVTANPAGGYLVSDQGVEHEETGQ